jgi:hypothetical protein
MANDVWCGGHSRLMRVEGRWKGVQVAGRVYDAQFIRWLWGSSSVSGYVSCRAIDQVPKCCQQATSVFGGVGSTAAAP